MGDRERTCMGDLSVYICVCACMNVCTYVCICMCVCLSTCLPAHWYIMRYVCFCACACLSFQRPCLRFRALSQCLSTRACLRCLRRVVFALSREARVCRRRRRGDGDRADKSAFIWRAFPSLCSREKVNKLPSLLGSFLSLFLVQFLFFFMNCLFLPLLFLSQPFFSVPPLFPLPFPLPFLFLFSFLPPVPLLLLPAAPPPPRGTQTLPWARLEGVGGRGRA